MLQESELERNRKLLDAFLVNRPIPTIYTVRPPKVPFGYIYCIENKINHKKYVGAVYSRWAGVGHPDPLAQLRKRACNYLYEYNNVVKDTSTAKRFSRPIIRAMVIHGFENFKMYPLAETSKEDHSAAEKYFIKTLNTVENGYNVLRGGGGTKRIGTRLMAKDKKLRSEGIVAVNPDLKQIIFADSMKLFGDYLHSTKDMIKNSVRKGRPYKGWFIFYIDTEKRRFVLAENVLGEGLPVNDRHSAKSKAFYQELEGMISLYLRDFCKTEYFSDFEVLPSLEYKDA